MQAQTSPCVFDYTNVLALQMSFRLRVLSPLPGTPIQPVHLLTSVW